VLEKIAWKKAEPVTHTHVFGVIFKNRLNHGQVEVGSREMRMSQCNLNGNAPLRTPYIDEGLVLLPGEQGRDAFRRTHTQTGHGAEEKTEPLRITIKRVKQALTSGRDFILRLSGAQSFGKRPPE